MAHSNGESTPRDQIPSEQIDRISSLPWNVLNIIFSFLSILDVVSTSRLARDWRYKWQLLSDFNLDSSTLRLGRSTANRKWEKVASIVNKYLRHHENPIRKFNLRANSSSHGYELCHWLQYLSSKTVEELSIQETGRISFEIPSYLFSFRNLSKLCLTSCSLGFPTDFAGFTSLREVFFRRVTVDGEYLSRLIFALPYLEKLALLRMSGVRILRIHAPRLKCLATDTNVGNIVIEAAPCLTTAGVVDFIGPPDKRMIFNSHSITHSLISLGSIRGLIISGYMIQFLAVQYGFGNFPWRNSNLVSLMFDALSLDAVHVVNFALSMLISCPNVSHFTFTLRSAKGKKLLIDHLQQLWGRVSFPKLQGLELWCRTKTGLGCSVNFVEYIGAHSPNLQFLTVLKRDKTEMNPTRVSKMINQLKKACPEEAVVKYVYSSERYIVT